MNKLKIRRILATALTVLTIFFTFVGCKGKDTNGYTIETSFDCCGTFIIIEEDNAFSIIVHKQTKVMYLYNHMGHQGGISVLVDENGKPLLWAGDLE